MYRPAAGERGDKPNREEGAGRIGDSTFVGRFDGAKIRRAARRFEWGPTFER